MPRLDPEQQRRFALEAVRRLREAGFEAYWAGGCVRDLLLGKVPQDYDVATNAIPAEIRRVFRRRRTIEVGAQFGVIGVVGPRGAGTLEVATFRSETSYSDGRHPDTVVFTSAEKDAQRRDFTINGLFYDPVADRVLDFVGGQEDLRQKVVRAIGAAEERFGEDKLRLLRAVRFAATLDFRLDPATWEALRRLAPQITVVSPERIAMEMQRLLEHPRRAAGLRLLYDSGLLAALLPEVLPLSRSAGPAGRTWWDHVLEVAGRLDTAAFTTALAAVLFPLRHLPEVASTADPSRQAARRAMEVGRRWRLSNAQRDRVAWLVEHQGILQSADQRAWSQVQPLLVHPGRDELLQLDTAELLARGEMTGAVDRCREFLAWPTERLDPPPLLTGEDLLAHGVPQGPLYKTLLTRVRQAQLDGQLHDRREALAAVDRWRGEPAGEQGTGNPKPNGGD